MILHLIIKISSKLDEKRERRNLVEDTSITNNQPINYLDTSLTDFLPKPHRPRSNHAIEKKLDVMNKRLMTVERNQVETKNILGYILVFEA
jgi:hypothetical protein